MSPLFALKGCQQNCSPNDYQEKEKQHDAEVLGVRRTKWGASTIAILSFGEALARVSSTLESGL